MQRNASEAFAFKQKQCAERCFAKLRRFLQHRMENWLQFAGRRTDDFQDFRCRRLLLQRFCEIVGALAQFIEQPRVLDGDNGLVSECSDQSNLFVRERAHYPALQNDHTNRGSLTHKRYAKHRPHIESAVAQRIIWIITDITDMDWPSLKNNAPGGGT